MIIAGEASGDTLGAELVRSLRSEESKEKPPVFIGAGGPKLAAAGVELLFDLAVHSVVGIWEVVKNYPKFKGLFDQLIDLAFREKPDCIILIDYPGFNLRFARAIRKKLITSPDPGWKPKIVYYVSPQIWAWHSSRVHQISQDMDLLLAIFPFEKQWYQERVPNFRVEFVGHPLIDRYASRADEQGEKRYLLLLPGSRQRELNKHLPVMIPAARRIQEEFGLPVRLLLADEKLAPIVAPFQESWPELEVTRGALDKAMTEAKVAIASSGTVTMECAYFGLPTVVIYKTSWSTYQLGKRFIKVRFIAMPNLLAQKEIFPELIQDDANADKIAEATRRFLKDPDLRAKTERELAQVIQSLGSTGASDRGASAILSLFNA
ncbi:MAG: Lipid-A-disaccharide synthase [Verrucomicrobiales bacterium]|nr:Lipid-A-disaccharide synthase [Verrucomicrobiales bacterium]